MFAELELLGRQDEIEKIKRDQANVMASEESVGLLAEQEARLETAAAAPKRAAAKPVKS